MSFAAVLLDLDGTLLNTLADLTDATNAMRIELGMHPLSQDVVATYLGKGTRNLVRRALSNSLDAHVDDELLDRGLEIFQRTYHLVNGDKTLLYPGVLEGLTAFREQGMRLAVVTNKPQAFTLPLLERSGLLHFFEHVVCGDTCAQRKPDPMPMLHACDLLDVAPADTLAIGDSCNDALAAKAAGITVLAVPYGYNEGQSVHTLEVDDIVSSIEEAAQWARNH
ncbi:phosphoglycolate phosphatase [Pusillimonas sp. CC-YST705]|uniref:Phosphoglycolate phosphatase n=1 Tax=Mesopusillimonas faecipullorum TaxID=2755040 RepID=A0ABS8CDU2_9BURK|nr:phosphoglycolate phosphatase [Mesopusillimonas faecipullorum]MCB5364196.1 phosphoglycolate phosphatase [Mesopusillimonas faecipullorum]